MPPTTTRIRKGRSQISPHLSRLVDFAEPTGSDVCLDLACGTGPVAAALGPRVRHVTAVDAVPPPRGHSAPGTAPHDQAGRSGPDGRTPTVLFSRGPAHAHPGDPDAPTVRANAAALPYRDGTFSLVTSRFSLNRMGDPGRALREMVRVCRPGGRIVIAEIVRPNLAGPERDLLERLRDPSHPGTPSVARLTDLISGAGADIRRLDVFTVERPVEPWLAEAPDPAAADRIRHALTLEVDGGPRTGAKPRVIGGELWFTQSWAHIAAQPVR